MKVKKIVIHSGWNSDSFKFTHDIAIMRLMLKIKFSVNVQPICIFTEDEKLTNNSASVASWGVVDDFNNIANKAQIVDLKIIDTAQCLFEEENLVRIFWLESFCAKSNNSGVCLGDSGSGLYVEIEGKYFLKGIVSSSLIQDCSRKTTALYSDVTKYFQFIKVVNFFTANIYF